MAREKKSSSENHCSECGKKLKELELNPDRLCNRCWSKIVRRADLSAYGII